MASICNFDEEPSSSTAKKEEMKINEREKFLQSGVVAKEKIETDETAGSSKEGIYKCPQCPNHYKNKWSLLSHMGIHVIKKQDVPGSRKKIKQIRCELCKDKVFATKQNYAQHMLTHTGEKLHECPTCNHWFARLGDLKTHQHIHLKEKTFKCLECPVDKYFQTRQQLGYHKSVHHKEKQYECSICHKTFHRKYNFKQHQLFHTNVREFQCAICEKRFNQSGDLKRHIRRHLVEKHYKCEMCDKYFTQPFTLKKHQMSCASLMEKRPHKCPKCPKRYLHEKGLDRHMEIHNKETTN